MPTHGTAMTARSRASAWQLFVPKLYTILRNGYTLDDLRADLLAGLTVSIVALPLSMALAIASGSTPEKGLHTAIIAGFLISLLGGSRVQIGGPTAAFVPVVFTVIEKFGYDGLIVCTIMAGVMLVIAGVLRIGTLMKYIPKPVVTGFTAGIAVSIFSSQIKDILGLPLDRVPAGFFPRWQAYGASLADFSPLALAMTVAALATIILLRRYRPAMPGFLIAVVAGGLAIYLFDLPVETIGSRFGDIPAALPVPRIPSVPLADMVLLLPSAFTIAFLAGIESLLSAVVADGMIGGRHRSNSELVAQGAGNIASALFGGLPATGAIARTATNIRAGARSPVAGIVHSVFLLLFMLLLAPAMSYVPMAALAAVLVMVAWGMSEVDSFRHLMRGPRGDRVVLVLTFVLTVVFDLTVAIQVGIVLAAFLFMHRMSQTFELESGITLIQRDEPDRHRAMLEDQRSRLPADAEVFQLAGPLFFAVSGRLDDVIGQFRKPPRTFVLRMGLVPMIDASGVAALRQMVERCRGMGTRVMITGLRPDPAQTLQQMGFVAQPPWLLLLDDFDAAMDLLEADAQRDKGD